jgi:ribosomal subunit interface protein
MMSSHMVFKGCDDIVKARLEEYWTKKLQRLQKVLVPYKADLQEIALTVYHHDNNNGRSWYEGRLAIHLPTGSLAAEADDKDPQAALDRVADKLVAEIKRHKEHVRQDHLYKRPAHERADLDTTGPLPQG